MPKNTKQIVVTIIALIIIFVVLFFAIRFLVRSFRKAVTGVNLTRERVATQPLEPVSQMSGEGEPARDFRGTVKFTGTVGEIIGNRAFTARETGIFGGEVLVLTKEDLAPIGAKTTDEYLVHPGDRLVIDGSLRKFNPDTIQKDYRVNLRMENLGTWIDEPVVIASDVDWVKQ